MAKSRRTPVSDSVELLREMRSARSVSPGDMLSIGGPGVLAHIQSYLRRSASFARDVERIGPFIVTITPHDDNRYLSYAIPDDGAVPSSSDIEALIAAFRLRDRIPRLEYFASLAPAVESKLVEHGFTPEGRLPVMVCPPEALRMAPVPAGIELMAPQSDDEILGMIAAQNEAYGDPAPGPGAVERHREFLEARGISVLARDAITGEPAGGGVCDVPYSHTTELAGIGVRVPFRRRGIAAAMTAWLAEKAFRTGTTTIFLMAAHDAEAHIYARVGFVVIGESLHISLSP